ncbi:class II fructose-bisphosphate aldolase [Vibrio nigripulchritudo]|uniref:class II fructose-bisphosphate aldolase n=1 Tax=Vibrio nigripulchritudo TaxID=28173 RepID=UPI0003B1ABE0|nr:class II fructose-bisphosphate aldolase [Vibrio nigripulchritudo]CCN69490.1 putative Ketose-bisphosphate aldolase,class-II [Vibrio nigripulchritudo SFn118]
MLVSLNEILPQASASSGAVACCNVFGIEEAIAIIKGAEAAERPVILAVNKDMVDLAGVEVMAGILVPLAKQSSVPVVVHLDHCYEETIVFKAMKAGFTSVMFDGSQLPFEENLSRTYQVSRVARSMGVSLEGELGSVPYEEGRDHIRSELTSPQEAWRYAKESGADVLAVSVGNVHRKTEADCPIHFELLQEIEQDMPIPLVIHGTTGIHPDDLMKLKRTSVAKFNVGTTLRMAMGKRIRDLMEQDKHFDRSRFALAAMPALQQEVERVLTLLAPD